MLHKRWAKSMGEGDFRPSTGPKPLNRFLIRIARGVCPEMRPVAVAKRPKKDRNYHASNWLFAQTTHVDVAPWNFHAGWSCQGSSYIFQVSWQSVEGSRNCGGRKSPSPINKANGLYNSLYYRTNRDAQLYTRLFSSRPCRYNAWISRKVFSTRVHAYTCTAIGRQSWKFSPYPNID